MRAQELKRKYFDFFVKKGHKKLPNVSLVPEDVSSSALFISAGMHPLIPNLLGEPHPLGKRLVSNQRCIRTVDIEEVGDPHHLTFFEMLGNWSLGDYWKEEAISWSWDFLMRELEFPKDKFYVTCFKGDKDAPKDEETATIWRKLGVPKNRIFFFGKKENWWGPVEERGPCGPDTEMFIDTGRKPCGPKCDPSCQCGKYFEVWNDVFMEYEKAKEGKYQPLKQKNVDTGMGVERVLTIMQGKDDIFLIKELEPIIRKIEEVSKKKYEGENKKAMRIIADHLRAATFAIADGVMPSNVEAGYIVRRLIRRTVVSGRKLGVKEVPIMEIADVVVESCQREYPQLRKNKRTIKKELELEEKKFLRTIDRGMNTLKKIFGRVIGGIDPENLPKGMIIKDNVLRIDGEEIFRLYETYGIPPELSQEIMTEWGVKFDDQTMRECNEALKKHQKLSRAGVDKKFAGGLADHSAAVTKLHTTTHLLHQALRDVLGDHVQQMGSNITPERLRFDFTHPEKLTEEQIEKVEGIINKKIKADLPVKAKAMSLAEAKKKGALAFFAEKYGDKVRVYSIGDYSKEVCGGPHVNSTGEIGGVKITKEKAIGTGKRRIYVQLA